MPRLTGVFPLDRSAEGLTGPLSLVYPAAMPQSLDYFDWRSKGRCRTLSTHEYDSLFFPSNGRSINKAKEFCLSCPVLNTCLQFALDTDSRGIWAGTNERERTEIKNALNLANNRAIKTKKKVKRRSFSMT